MQIFEHRGTSLDKVLYSAQHEAYWSDPAVQAASGANKGAHALPNLSDGYHITQIVVGLLESVALLAASEIVHRVRALRMHGGSQRSHQPLPSPPSAGHPAVFSRISATVSPTRSSH